MDNVSIDSMDLHLVTKFYKNGTTKELNLENGKWIGETSMINMNESRFFNPDYTNEKIVFKILNIITVVILCI